MLSARELVLGACFWIIETRQEDQAVRNTNEFVIIRRTACLTAISREVINSSRAEVIIESADLLLIRSHALRDLLNIRVCLFGRTLLDCVGGRTAFKLILGSFMELRTRLVVISDITQ